MNFTKIIRQDRPAERFTIAVLSAVHALVDAVCAAIIFSLVNIYPLDSREYLCLVAIYNMLAFALQPLCGMLADRFVSAHKMTVAGVLFSIAAVMSIMRNPYLAVSLAGLGNALFHVGGGVAVLSMRRRRAWPCGIFVAPGAAGLAIGAMTGRAGIPPLLFLNGLLWASIVVILICRFPVKTALSDMKNSSISNRGVAVALLLLSIALRSLIGFSAIGMWHNSPAVLPAFAIAAMCGKAVGGFLSDRFGWTRTGSTALLSAALLFLATSQNAWYAVSGMLLLQMTMPLTLAAMSCLLPQRPGLAFGLCCLALVAGAAPAFSPWSLLLKNTTFIVTCTVGAAAVFYMGLRMTGKRTEKEKIQYSIPTGMEFVN